MKNCIIILIIALGLISCNSETITIVGDVNGFMNSEIKLLLKSKNGNLKVLKSDIEIANGKFKTIIKDDKPPFKITMLIDDKKGIDFWIFKYGNFDFELNDADELIINNSFENNELKRVNETYNKMYLKPLKEQMDWVANYASTEHEETNEADEEMLERYKSLVKKAYHLRKKSILKTIRKAPQNPISMSLFFDEYETLTKWQRKECLKLAQKYYSDTGMNWQLKH